MLKKILYTLLFLFLGVCGVFYYLLATTSGLNLVVNQVNSLTEGSVQIKSSRLDGNLLHGVELENFNLHLPHTLNISAKYLKLDYDLLGTLTSGAFVVNSLRSNELRVHLLLDDTQEPNISAEIEEPLDDNNAPPFELNFPVDIYINQLKLKNFAYLSDIVNVYVHNFDVKLFAQKNFAMINGGNADGVFVELKNDDNNSKSSAENQENEVNSAKTIYATMLNSGKLNEVLNLHLPDLNSDEMIAPLYTVDLPLDVGIIHLNVKNVRYMMSGFDSSLCSLNVSALWNKTLLSVLKLNLNHPLFSADIKGSMNFENHYDMDYDLNLIGNNDDFTKYTYDGIFYNQAFNAKVKGPLSDLNLDLHSLNDDKVNLDVSFNALSNNLDIKFNGSVDNFAYPLNSDEKIFTLEKFNVQGQGSILKGVDYDIDTFFSGYGFNQFSIQSQGVVSSSNLKLNDLNLNGQYLGSKVNIKTKANVNYEKNINVQDDFDLKLSNAAFIDKSLQGALDIKAKVDFSYDYQDFCLKVETLNSNFLLNNRPVKGSIKNLIVDSQEKIATDELKFTQGRNELVVKGSSTDDNGIMANLTIRFLPFIHETLRGNLLATVNFKGNFTDYYLQFKGNSHEFSAGDFKLSNFIFNGNYDSVFNAFAFTSFASTMAFSKNLQPSQRCMFEVSGDLNNHHIQSGCGGVNSGFLSFTGGWSELLQQYHGSIDEFFIANQVNGNLSMQKPTAIMYDKSKGRGKVDSLHLEGKLGSLDVGYINFGPEFLQTKARINKYNLANLSLLLGNNNDLRAKGLIDVDLIVNYTPVNPDIKLSVVGDNLFVDIYKVPMLFNSFNFKANLTQHLVSLDTKALLAHNFGKIDTKINVANPLGSKNLSGYVKVDNLNLAIFSLVASMGVNQIEGRANLDTTLSGTLNDPYLNGNLDINGNLEPRYAIGVVENYNLNLGVHGQRGNLHGKINLNGTDINLNGSLDWSDGAYANLNVNTTNLPVFLVGYGRADANLNTNVSFNDDYLDIKGTSYIDSARIKVQSITDSAVMPSSDEIIISKQGLVNTNFKKPTNLRSHIDLQFSLGNDVLLSAMGLNSNIAGSVWIHKELEDRDVKGQGQIYLVNGKAELYGHKFIVNRASSNFNGNIVNPGLDVEVIADPQDLEDDVTVGVHVTGYAQNPKIAFFSKPQMSQNEILSYILYGHGLEKSSSAQDANNSNILLSLGLSSTTSLVTGFVNALGIDGLEFNTQGSGDDTQVAVQGYLTRKIKVSYGYGIFSTIGEFKLRYELMRSLYAEFISSIDQAVDLVYSFEFN